MAFNPFLNPYIDPNTGTAYNKLGIDDPVKLQEVEAELSRFRFLELQLNPLKGQFDLPHLQALHRHILQDVYTWAGEIRRDFDSTKFDPEAGRTRSFTPAARIAVEATVLFSSLKADNYYRGLSSEDFAARAAALLNSINSIHGFPDGNGRAQRAFLEQLGREAGHPLDFSIVSQERMVRASVAGMDGDLAPMTRILVEASDPIKIEQMRKAISFLDHHRGVVDWNNTYLATTVPGQSYSGQLVSLAGSDFMMRDDRGLIIVGNVADLPKGAEPPQRTAFTAAKTEIPAPGIQTVSSWERQALDLMSFDLHQGVSPAEIVRNWTQWNPEKGNEAYFSGLVQQASAERGVADHATPKTREQDKHDKSFPER